MERPPKLPYSFTKVMTSTNTSKLQSYLNVPMPASRGLCALGMKGAVELQLIGLGGSKKKKKCWPVILSNLVDKGQGYRVRGGWGRFMRDNEFVCGDILAFTVLKPTLVSVKLVSRTSSSLGTGTPVANVKLKKMPHVSSDVDSPSLDAKSKQMARVGCDIAPTPLDVMSKRRPHIGSDVSPRSCEVKLKKMPNVGRDISPSHLNVMSKKTPQVNNVRPSLDVKSKKRPHSCNPLLDVLLNKRPHIGDMGPPAHDLMKTGRHIDPPLIEVMSTKRPLKRAHDEYTPSSFTMCHLKIKACHIRKPFLLDIPTEFAKHIPKLPSNAGVIQGVSGKTRNASESTISTHSWRKFVLDYEIKEGDVCIFKLLSSSKVTLHIYVYKEDQGKPYLITTT